MDEPDGITCRIADVVRRFHLRLRCIQVPRRKRGRTEMEIMYVSQTSGREIPFGGNDVPTLNFPASPVRAPEQGDDAEYIETDEPLGMDGPLFDAPESLQADNAQFEQMVSYVKPSHSSTVSKVRARDCRKWYLLTANHLILEILT